MNDEKILFIAFILLYLIENILFLKRSSIAFVSITGLRFSAKFPSTTFGNKNGGIVMTNPFPTLGYVFVSNILPFSLNKEGLISFISNCLAEDQVYSQTKCLFLWKDIKNVKKVGNEIFVNGKLFLKHKSAYLLERWQNLIEIIKNLPVDSREEYIKRYVKSSIDIDDIIPKKKSFVGSIIYLKIICNFIWIYIFILSPILIIHFGFLNIIIKVFILYLFLHFAAVLTFVFTINRLDLRFSKTEYILNLFKVVIFPPTLIRACDLLSINLFNRFHPVALSHVLLSKEKFQDFVRMYVLDLKYPISISDLNEKAKHIVNEFNNSQVELISLFLKKHNYKLKSILTPSFSKKDNIKSFCPRCHSGFIIEKKECANCTGIKLLHINESLNL